MTDDQEALRAGEPRGGRAALAIFVKTPGLSPIKTRLAADLGAASATRFHRLAAAAVAAAARTAGGAVHPYWAVAEAGALAHPDWAGFPSIGQGEGELGARLHHVYAGLLETHRRVLLVGADMPLLSADLLRRALAVLEEPGTPFVIGPATDGGFWLFGGREPIPAAVWQGVAYSRDDTAAQLLGQLAAIGRVGTLPRFSDVDTLEDLAALRRGLRDAAALLPEQMALRDWLDTLGAGS